MIVLRGYLKLPNETKSTNNKDKDPEHLTISAEYTSGQYLIYLMTIYWNNKYQQIRVLLYSRYTILVLSL
jgi:hypothetical protein